MKLFGSVLNFDDYVDILWILKHALSCYKDCLEADLLYYESRPTYLEKQDMIRSNLVKVVQISHDLDDAISEASPIHYERDNYETDN